MIIINLMGGLGNQMFQYAMAKHLSIINETELKIDTSIFREREGSAFKPCILDIKADSYLIGYFNSYKYFDTIRNVLIDEFTPRKESSLQGRDMLMSIESSNSVSLHIRRGDYVDSPDGYKCIEGIITERFYHNAVALIASKVVAPHFFVFSNDMTWVRENFRIPYQTTFVDFNTALRGYEDLWLMSRCKQIGRA